MVRVKYGGAKEVKDLEKQVKASLDEDNWERAGRIMKVAIRIAKKDDSLVYAEELDGKYAEIKRGKNPYEHGKSRPLFSLTFVAFALGVLLLGGSITGNVVAGVGKAGSGLLGAVLVGFGVVGVLILTGKMK